LRGRDCPSKKDEFRRPPASQLVSSQSRGIAKRPVFLRQRRLPVDEVSLLLKFSCHDWHKIGSLLFARLFFASEAAAPIVQPENVPRTFLDLVSWPASSSALKPPNTSRRPPPSCTYCTCIRESPIVNRLNPASFILSSCFSGQVGSMNGGAGIGDAKAPASTGVQANGAPATTTAGGGGCCTIS